MQRDSWFFDSSSIIKFNIFYYKLNEYATLCTYRNFILKLFFQKKFMKFQEFSTFFDHWIKLVQALFLSTLWALYHVGLRFWQFGPQKIWLTLGAPGDWITECDLKAPNECGEFGALKETPTPFKASAHIRTL